MTYAEKTSVSSAKSRAEIERTLTRYGADQFLYGWNDKDACVGFRMSGRQVRFILPMPERSDFYETPTGKSRTAQAVETAYEQAVRQKWRALALCIKAKLEAVESGITEFDDEFLAHIMLPNGQTMGQWAKPQVEQAYLGGDMPPLLTHG